jgi:hypothetical protein
MLDDRSEKKYLDPAVAPPRPLWRGVERNTAWQEDTKAAIRGWLGAYAGRALVIMTHGCTFHPPIINVPDAVGGAPRDGASIYSQRDLWEIMEAARNFGYGARNSLVIWTGDDHHGKVGDWTLVPPRDRDVTTNVFPQPHDGHPVGYREFKVVSGPAQSLGTTYFGDGKLYHNSTDSNSWVLWDITTQSGGREAVAHATYMNTTIGTPLVDSLGRVADWWFDNGAWMNYNTSRATVVQTYPGDGGHASPWLFQRWYMDEINGTMHPEFEVVRDSWTHRLRAVHDLDDPATDELRDGWTWPTEETHPEP